ncbi:MAG: acetolactate decarboxylase, partial [Cyclobacteriaceae bacterium]|nr:acetolactate decarboxylase [Cyclobacteriaceae bacterium]
MTPGKLKPTKNFVPKNIFLALLSGLLLYNCDQKKPESTAGHQSPIRIVGMMRNVMMKGELAGTLNLDTISNKEHLYGMGPVEFLSGEILIWDGTSYVSAVTSDTSMRVTNNFNVKAPFFAYAQITNWKEYVLPDSVHSMKQLESFLYQSFKDAEQPFFFKLTGSIDHASIHVVNLPAGRKVRSREDAHEGKRSYTLVDKPAEVLGFFSTGHQTIFTHHDSFLHMHLITTDKKWMGHLDELIINPQKISLLIPT